MLESILRTGIPTQISRQLSKSELDSLMESYALLEKALDDFNQGLITWEEYLDLAEMHDLNMDSYLSTIDHNLQLIGMN